MDEIILTGVREYGNEYDVVLREKLHDGVQRLVVIAWNQSGYDATEVDLLDLLEWVKQNRPELLR